MLQMGATGTKKWKIMTAKNSKMEEGDCDKIIIKLPNTLRTDHNCPKCWSIIWSSYN
jgi:hypothetical protein